MSLYQRLNEVNGGAGEGGQPNTPATAQATAQAEAGRQQASNVHELRLRVPRSSDR